MTLPPPTPYALLRAAAAAFLAAALTAPAWSPAAEAGYKSLREQHPWAKFPVGAWKRVRVTAESFDEAGRLRSTSTTETTTTLVDVDDSGYTLCVDVVVEVAGKRFRAQPQYRRQGFFGEVEGQRVQVREAGKAEVAVDDAKVPCRVLEVTIEGQDVRQTAKLFWSDAVFPHALRREAELQGGGDPPTSTKVTAQVVALNMPVKVLAEVKSAAYVKIRQETAQGTSITLEIQSPDVPGGVVAHSSKQLDQQGRLAARSTLELVDYGLSEAGNSSRMLLRPRLFPRLRSHPR